VIKIKEKSLVEEIYKTSPENLPNLAKRAIKEAISLLEDYADKITKNENILKNRWILINLLHVLYKDVFLLQTDDLKMIMNSPPKHLNKDLMDRCRLCNKDLTPRLEIKGINEDELIKALCLDCFISVVNEGEWWKKFAEDYEIPI
jgi:hypothetical protein